MIRVAIIIGKMDSGGKKNLVMEYYRHVDRNTIQFDFICNSDSQAIPEAEIKSLGGNVYRIVPFQNILGNMRDIYRLCKRNGYQVMHAYNSTMNVFAMFPGKLAGVPIRISESLSMAHDGEFKTVIKKILRPFSKFCATNYVACGRECGLWQFGSKLYDSGQIAIFKTAVNTKAHAYDPKVREKTRRTLGVQDRVVIGHIGRFVPQKNPVFMLEIFHEVCKLETKAVLLLIGDGQEKELMFKRMRELGIEERVIYLGRREDIRQFYNAMDLFLLPSLYEGLPVVGLEAQSCGLPVFFSDEITGEASACELGYFISLDTPAHKWAEEILKVINENKKKRCSRACDVAEAGFDSISEAKRIQQYYTQAIAGKESR